jgi:NAD(P)-dependent dehydrogenase (short-subunit alcohol dehydrogenase family)
MHEQNVLVDLNMDFGSMRREPADWETVHIGDIVTLRRLADDLEQRHSRIDIVVANAAIQRWMSLLEMEDADWCEAASLRDLRRNSVGRSTPASCGKAL